MTDEQKPFLRPMKSIHSQTGRPRGIDYFVRRTTWTLKAAYQTLPTVEGCLALLLLWSLGYRGVPGTVSFRSWAKPSRHGVTSSSDKVAKLSFRSADRCYRGRGRMAIGLKPSIEPPSRSIMIYETRRRDSQPVAVRCLRFAPLRRRIIIWPAAVWFSMLAAVGRATASITDIQQVVHDLVAGDNTCC